MLNSIKLRMALLKAGHGNKGLLQCLIHTEIKKKSPAGGRMGSVRRSRATLKGGVGRVRA